MARKCGKLIVEVAAWSAVVAIVLVFAIVPLSTSADTVIAEARDAVSEVRDLRLGGQPLDARILAEEYLADWSGPDVACQQLEFEHAMTFVDTGEDQAAADALAGIVAAYANAEFVEGVDGIGSPDIVVDDAQFECARALIRLQERVAATAILEEFPRRFPGSNRTAAAAMTLGHSYRMNGEVAAAGVAFAAASAAADSENQAAGGLVRAGLAYKNSGDRAAALRAFEQAYTDWPGHSHASFAHTWHQRLSDQDFERLPIQPASASGALMMATSGGGDMLCWECDVCGYLYKPCLGEPDLGIPPGTSFAALPADWTCPHCNVSKEYFTRDCPYFDPLCEGDLSTYICDPDDECTCSEQWEGGPPPEPPLPSDGVLRPGQGLPRETVDWDTMTDCHGSTDMSEGAGVTDAAVKSPCDDVTPFKGDEPGAAPESATPGLNRLDQLASWSAKTPGLHTALVTVDDAGDNVDDPPTFCVYSFEVLDYGRSCEGCRTVHTDLFTGFYLGIPLGGTTDGRDAGALYLNEVSPRHDLVTAGSVRYDIHTDGVSRIRNTSTGELTVSTPLYRVEVATINDYTIEIQFYDRSTSDLIRYLRITDIDEAVAPDGIDDHIRVVEYVDDGAGGFAVHVVREFESLGGSRWRLTTAAGLNQSDELVDVLQVEEAGWAGSYTDSEGRSCFEREYEQRHPSTGLVVKSVTTRFTEFEWGIGYTSVRRTSQVVGGRVTTWDWEADEDGLRVTLIERPDGSWTHYDYDIDDSQGDVRITEIGGWKDTSYSDTLSHLQAGVRSKRSWHYGSELWRKGSVKEWVNGELVRYEVLNHYVDGDGGLLSTQAYAYSSATESLLTETEYATERRPTCAVLPDGRRIEYEYDDATTFAGGANPTYSTDNGGVYHYKAVVDGADNAGQIEYIDGKSTKQITILSATGQPVLRETRVWDGGNSAWVALDWACVEYDNQDRVTDVYYADGTSEGYVYSDCCGYTRTDPTGVQTTRTLDALGRVTEIERHAVASTQYATQPAVFIRFDYDTANQVRVTVTDDATCSQVHVSKYDGNGRMVAQWTENENPSDPGDDGQYDLKTMYQYGTTAQGGDKVTAYFDYPVSASGGSVGVRDLIVEYYADGRIKSVGGDAAITRHFDYGSAASAVWTRVDTVTSGRYIKASYDMLGRIKSVERPHTAGSVAPSVHYYNYRPDGHDDAGLLWRIYRPNELGQPSELFEYDELGRVVRTVVDADNDGNIDEMGPDRITTIESHAANVGGSWSLVNKVFVRPEDDSTNKLVRERRTAAPVALSSPAVAEITEIDVVGSTTVTTVTLDATAHTQTLTRNVPASTTDAVWISFGGQLVSATDAVGLQTTFGYDPLGRRTTVTAPSGDVTTIGYDGAGRVSHRTDGDSNRTKYAYYTDTAAHPGQLYYVEQPDVGTSVGNRTYYAYNGRGQVDKVWGSASYPTLIDYNDYGERVKLTTFRNTAIDFNGGVWPSGVDHTTGNTTQWQYDVPTGWMTKKIDASGSEWQYTYWRSGRLNGRIWARQHAGADLATYYYYNDGVGGSTYTGELVRVDYADNTRDVEYDHDRLGRIDWVTDAAGKRRFDYDPASLARTAVTFVDDGDPGTSDLFIGKLLTTLYEDGTETNGVDRRFKGVQFGTTADPDAHGETIYGYDAVGRIERVSGGPGLPNGGVTYQYHSANLNGRLNRTRYWHNSSTLFMSSRTPNPTGGVLTNVTNRWYAGGVATVSAYDYEYNARWQPMLKQRSGSAFGSNWYARFAHNDRGELTSSLSFGGVSPDETNPAPIRDRMWSYDQIGNRTESVEGTSAPVYYCANQLNQYTQLDPTSDCQPPFTAGFAYDADGNLTDKHGLTLEYDAENQLVAAYPAMPIADDKKLTFSYDYVGRRLEKKVYVYTTQWPVVPDEHVKYVWDGWQLVAELDGLNGDALLRSYTWGLDVSETLGGAGGVGGLLAIHDATIGVGGTDYLVAYDGLGNVGQVLPWGATSASAALAAGAAYEYDAFGRLHGSSGSYADINAWRFSTKQFDAETGLGYWGYRYYDPQLGRWINRDPLGELGGLNLYGYVGNMPLVYYDLYGLGWGWFGGWGETAAVFLQWDDYGSDPHFRDYIRDSQDETAETVDRITDERQELSKTAENIPGAGKAFACVNIALDAAQNDWEGVQDSAVSAASLSKLKWLRMTAAGVEIGEGVCNIANDPCGGDWNDYLQVVGGVLDVAGDAKQVVVGLKGGGGAPKPSRVSGPAPTRRTAAENAKARNSFKNNKDAARKAWEKRTGKEWPVDENGNPWPAEHTPPLKEGGDPMNVTPRDPGAPDPHNIPGPDGLTDYQRWGAEGTPARDAKRNGG